MIIDGYLWNQIIKPAFIALAVLVGVYFCYMTTKLLNDTVIGNLEQNTILTLASLYLLVATPVLLPTAYYLSVVTSLSRLYQDAEFPVLLSLGWSEWRLSRIILLTSLGIGIVTAILTIWVRPWAYGESHQIKAQSRLNAQILGVASDTFIVLDDNLVLNAKSADEATGALLDVFLYIDHPTEERIIIADRSLLSDALPNVQRTIRFWSGAIYWLNKEGGAYREYTFDELQLVLDNSDEANPGQHRRSMPTKVLAKATTTQEIAEFQWRMSLPFAAFLIGAMAVPLSRTAPRQSGNRQLLIALVAYAVVFYVAGATRRWVENGIIGTTPGIWSVWILLAAGVAFLYFRPGISR